jgi:SAM-dependent methyltransferase
VGNELTSLQGAVNELLRGRTGLTVLEAGCGSLSYLKFPAGSRIIGIDIDQDQLGRNTQLNERIYGDIQTYDLGRSRFDAIVCWNVLEHLEHPEQALARFAAALRDDGIIILSAPNLLSPKGLVTRFTPLAFHVWFYRNVRGYKEAGTIGNPPFRTYLKSSMTPTALRGFARAQGLAVAYERVVGSGDSRDVLGRRSRTVDLFVVPLNLLLFVATLGRVDSRRTQYFIVLHKRVSTSMPNSSSGEAATR